MVYGDVLEKFIAQRPIAVMVRVALEKQLSPAFFDETFELAARQQYCRELAFSTCAHLLSQVTLGKAPSVHAAFQKERETIPVSLVSLYDKLSRVEPVVCEELILRSARDLNEVLQSLTPLPEPLSGRRLRFLDGNVLAGTEHRLKELRDSGAAALPGLSLVLYDHATQLITGLVACEDGHTNERKLVDRLLPLVQANDLIVADRNFCTLDLMSGICDRLGTFLIRHHAGSSLAEQGKRKACGRCRTGRVYEQRVAVSNGLSIRSIIVERDKPMKDGSHRIILLTNVSAQEASARRLANLYLERWTIEEVFRQLTEYLSCEVRTLGYPKAALFAFTLAALAYNTLSCVKSALAAGHPQAKSVDDWSTYYMAWEVKATFEGMLVAVPAEEWDYFNTLSNTGLATLLKDLAAEVNYAHYAKHKRGRKKPVMRNKVSRGSHMSTAKVLEERKKKRQRSKTS
jgi:hypothetical protein